MMLMRFDPVRELVPMDAHRGGAREQTGALATST
ncbi:MAG: hypothetical protein QOE35_1962 [Actinomycetota bacterium]|jgi:hypothetical protein